MPNYSHQFVSPSCLDADSGQKESRKKRKIEEVDDEDVVDDNDDESFDGIAPTTGVTMTTLATASWSIPQIIAVLAAFSMKYHREDAANREGMLTLLLQWFEGSIQAPNDDDEDDELGNDDGDGVDYPPIFPPITTSYLDGVPFHLFEKSFAELTKDMTASLRNIPSHCRDILLFFCYLAGYVDGDGSFPAIGASATVASSVARERSPYLSISSKGNRRPLKVLIKKILPNA